MQLTNKHELPRAMFQAIEREIYRPNPDLLRVTELINPPLIKTLALRHWDELVLDASDFLTTFLGTAGHYILSLFKADGVLTEHRMKVPIPGSDRMLKGTADLIVPEQGLLQDYKFVSVFSYIFGKERGFEDYTQQLNVYAWMCKELGIADIERAELNMILRDWHASKRHEDNYPDVSFVRVPIHLWGYKAQTEFINQRLHLHETQADRECTPDEKWQKPTTYAIMEKGKKKALAATHYVDGVRKPFTSPQEADEVIKERKLTNRKKNGTVWVEKRPGQCVRCENWCYVSQVCPYAGKSK